MALVKQYVCSQVLSVYRGQTLENTSDIWKKAILGQVLCWFSDLLHFGVPILPYIILCPLCIIFKFAC